MKDKNLTFHGIEFPKPTPKYFSRSPTTCQQAVRDCLQQIESMPLEHAWRVFSIGMMQPEQLVAEIDMARQNIQKALEAHQHSWPQYNYDLLEPIANHHRGNDAARRRLAYWGIHGNVAYIHDKYLSKVYRSLSDERRRAMSKYSSGWSIGYQAEMAGYSVLPAVNADREKSNLYLSLLPLYALGATRIFWKDKKAGVLAEFAVTNIKHKRSGVYHAILSLGDQLITEADLLRVFEHPAHLTGNCHNEFEKTFYLPPPDYMKE